MQTINLSRDDAEDELKYLLDVVLPPFGSMVKDLNIYDGDCGDNVCGAGYTLKGPYGKAVESLVAQLMDGLYHLTSLSMGYVPSLSRPYGHFASLTELSFNIVNPDTSDLTAIILSSPNLVELCINIQWTISSKRSLFAAAIASREKLSILHLVGPTDYFTREFAEAEWKCPLATLWIGHQPTWSSPPRLHPHNRRGPRRYRRKPPYSRPTSPRHPQHHPLGCRNFPRPPLPPLQQESPRNHQPLRRRL
jgi:hypothetical protein